jgi:hypothetical protein
MAATLNYERALAQRTAAKEAQRKARAAAAKAIESWTRPEQQDAVEEALLAASEATEAYRIACRDVL